MDPEMVCSLSNANLLWINFLAHWFYYCYHYVSVCWGILMLILSVFLCREWTGLSTCMNKYVVAWFNYDFSCLLQELMVMFLCYASLTCLFWFIWQGINGILADEMGLGKTVQSIAFLSYLAEVSFIVHMKIYTSELPLSFWVEYDKPNLIFFSLEWLEQICLI